MPGYSVIGRLATFDSSSVRWPSQPASTNPAVVWISRPRRPRLLLPSSRATRSSGSATRSAVEPSTNSPGWRMKTSSSPISTSSVRSSWSSFTSMTPHRVVAEHPEVAVEVQVDRRRLDAAVVERVDDDAAVGELLRGSCGRRGSRRRRLVATGSLGTREPMPSDQGLCYGDTFYAGVVQRQNISFPS